MFEKEIETSFIIAATIYPSILRKGIKIGNNLFIDFISLILPQYIILLDHKLAYVLVIAMLAPFVKRSNLHGRTRNWSKSCRVIRTLQATITVSCIVINILENAEMLSEKFQPTTFYGISVGDLFRSFIVLIEGYKCARKSKESIHRRFILSLMAGIVICFINLVLGIKQDITQYGSNLNFFLVLSSSYIFFMIFKSKHNFKLALSLIIVQEYYLRVGKLDEVIFSEKRTSWMMRNKEGLNAILPTFVMFLFSSYIGRKMTNKRATLPSILVALFITCLFIISYGYSEEISFASRRLGNLSYVMLALSLFFSHFMCLYVADWLFPLILTDLQLFISHHMILMVFMSEVGKMVMKDHEIGIRARHTSPYFSNFFLLTSFIVIFYLFRLCSKPK
ncbi:putative GWT1 protein [Trachipleistophora hominis]|uniref:GPI-anchored wall transfer protein 1 n=1 Tax=Trachipleistophora hominis TaxID=72359 RepID=L7JXS4_TRAHO|nr:putative GWT1 protein [Trachipleistophora hominis]